MSQKEKQSSERVNVFLLFETLGRILSESENATITFKVELKEEKQSA